MSDRRWNWIISRSERVTLAEHCCPPVGRISRFKLSPRSLTIPGAWSRARAASLLRRPTMHLASGCVRCDPVSLVTLMQPEIYCRWLCADGSTRCRRMRRRRRWGPRPRLSNGRYRLTWPRRRPRCIPPIDAKHGALPARWREDKLVPVIFASIGRSVSLSLSFARSARRPQIEKQENRKKNIFTLFIFSIYSI